MTDKYLEGIMNRNNKISDDNVEEPIEDPEFQKSHPLARRKIETIKPLDVYTKHTEIRHLVHSEIKKLLVTLGPSNSHIIYRFLECLTPLKSLHDTGRLPVYATRPRSTTPDKRYCVLALVSCLVQAYWKYESDYTPKEKTVSLLIRLEEINKCYPEMKIAGAENKGFWLEL